MPLIYRRTSDGPGSPQDVEDDIVLSDLIRGTGEASRLRRRGALRVDRVYTAVNRPSRWEVYVPYEEDQVPSTASAPVAEQSQQPQGQQQPSFALPFPVAPPLDLNRDENDEYTFVLRCGASRADPHPASESQPHYLHSTPFYPSLLPLYPPCPSESQKPRFRPPEKQTTNGCGAIVHTKAAPRPKLGMWTAKTEASDSVVHLDPCYFDSAAVGKMVRSVCGCVREGVGCSVCGNPLGTLYTPCKSATDGVFFAPPRSIRSSQAQPLQPQQPQPQPQPQPQQLQSSPPPPPPPLPPPQQPTSSPKLHVYSFFATAVSSHPPYKFPPSSSSSSSAGTAPPRHPYPIPPPTSLQTLSRLPYPGVSLQPRYVPPNPNLLLNSYPYPASRGANSNPNPNPNPNATATATGNPNAGYAYPGSGPTPIGYSYPFSHPSFPSLRDDEEAEGSVSGDVVADGLFQEMDEGEFDDDEDEDEGEDEEDPDPDDGEGEDQGRNGEDRLSGIWMARPTARDVLRAPRMRRTFSSMGDRDTREGGSGFFFGRGYATASPIPLSDLGEDGGAAAAAPDGGEGEGEGEDGVEDADEMGAEEEGDDESFTLDEEEYYDSSPEASPRLSALQIQQDVTVEEDAGPHSSGSFTSSSSSSDKAEST